MTPEQHLAEAEKYVQYAHAETGRDYGKGAMFAAIATAHAAIAAAKQGAKR